MTELRLKGIALGGLVGLFTLLIFSVSFSSTPSSFPTINDRNQEVSTPDLRVESDITTDTQHPLREHVLSLPMCRARYINLSKDAAYPIPHWVYSLPKDADKALVLAIARNESRFRPYARSNKGAVGLMQIMPDTARYMLRPQHGGVRLASSSSDFSSYVPRNPFDFHDPYVSLAVGYRYIRYLQDKPYIGHNLVYTLAAYNAGPGNLQRWRKGYGARVSGANFAARIPYRETREYVQKVLRDYRRYQTLLPKVDRVVWAKQRNC
jgi:Transglycosylase SLT domain